MIKITKILNHGGACPFQIDALTDDNRMVYGRYKGGWLKVYIGEQNDLSEDAATSNNSQCVFHQKIGADYDGYIDLEAFKIETEDVIDWPEND